MAERLVSYAWFAMAVPEGAEAPSPFIQLLPMLAIFAVFYLLFFAPMRRREKQHREMLAAIKSGDRVVTRGGIYGTVAGIDGDVVQLRIADQVRIQIERSAIAGRLTEGG